VPGLRRKPLKELEGKIASLASINEVLLMESRCQVQSVSIRRNPRT
jgi:hypothetical protein